MKRCTLGFTDRRILHIYTSARLVPRNSYAEARYEHIESAARRMRLLYLSYTDGSKEPLYGLIPTQRGLTMWSTTASKQSSEARRESTPNRRFLATRGEGVIW